MPPISSAGEASSSTSSSIASIFNLPVKMDRLKGILASRNGSKGGRDANPDEYEPLRNSSDDVVDDEETSDEFETPFSWLEYSIFVAIGVAMLWAW